MSLGEIWLHENLTILGLVQNADDDFEFAGWGSEREGGSQRKNVLEPCNCQRLSGSCWLCWWWASPPPLPPACCTFWLRLMEWNYTRGGKGNSVGPESEQSQIHLYRVIGIPHLDWQQRYLLPIPLHSVVDPALPCTSPISFPLDQFTFEFLQFCTIEKNRGLKKG